MKQRFELTLLLAFAVLAACNREVVESPSNIEIDDVLYAQVETPCDMDTKSYVSDDLRVLWDASDAASVFKYITVNQKYTYSGSAGTNNSSFTKTTSGSGSGTPLDYIYAVYPYNSGISISVEGTINNVLIPGTQTYKAESFGKEANVAVSASEDSQMLFKNLCGYVKIRLYGDNVTVSKVSLKSINGETISGYATVSVAVGNNPSLTFVSSKSSEIVLTCPGGVKLGTSKASATEFWFVVPPVTLSRGFKIAVYENDAPVFEKNASSRFTVERNLLKKMAPLKVEKPTVSSVTFDKSTYTVKRGESIQLTPTILPAAASSLPVSWKSSNTSWATVDGSGNVTGLVKGKTVTITATVGSVSGTCNVKVEAPDLVSFSLSPNPVSMYPLDQVKVTAVLNPSDAEVTTEYWYIDADSIAGVGGGGDCWRYVNAFKPGSAVLRVVLNGNIERTVTINVQDPAPAAVDLGLSVKWGDRNLFAESATATGRYLGFKDALGYESTNSDAAEYFTDGRWRLPTKAECQELLDKCTYKTETLNGVTGLRFTSKSNDASIFLPDVGGYMGSTYYAPNAMGCFYWSKTVESSNSYRLYWTTASHKPSISVLEAYLANDYKFVVRPVKAN